jgi:K+-sensing histidine kinase KdpD
LPIIVNVDTAVLRLMVKNLLDNALKYSPPDSPVRLAIGTNAIEWWIRVENEMGQAGLPDPKRLFEKYYRAEKAHAHTGTGLGLYWVRGIARQIGGEVTYSQEPSGHIVFELRLPC